MMEDTRMALNTLEELCYENRRLKLKLANERRKRAWERYDEAENEMDMCCYSSREETVVLKRLVRKKDREICSLKRKIRCDELRLEWLGKVRTEAEDNERKLKQMINELENSGWANTLEKDNLKWEIQGLREKIGQLEREMQKSHKKCADVTKKNGEFWSRHMTDTFEKNKLNQNIYEGKMAIEELREKNRQLEKEMQSIKKMYTDVTNENNLLRRDWTDTFEKDKLNQEVFEANMELQRLREKNQQLEKEIQKIEKNCADTENEKLLRRPNDEQRLKNENQRLQEEKQRLQDDKNNLLVEIHNLREEQEMLSTKLKKSYENDKMFITKERNQLQETISLLQNENKKLQKDMATMSKDRLKKSQTEVEHNQSAIQLLKEKNKEKERENIELTKAIYKEMEERKNLMKIVKEQDGLHSLRENVRVLEGRSKLTKEWSRSTDTEKELEQLRNKIKDSEQQMERREWSRPNDTELNQLRTKVKNFEEEKIRLVGKLNRSDDIQNKLQAKINEMIEEKAQQLKRSITTEKELNRLQAKVRDIEEEKTRLEQQLNKSCDAQIEITKLRAKVNKMEEERAHVERQSNKTLDKERERNELRVMLENKDKEEARLTGQLNRSNDMEKELKQLRVKVNEMEVEKSRLTQQLNRSNNTERELDQLRVKVNELEVDKATLTGQVSRSNDGEKERAELRVKVRTIEDENRNLAQQLKKMNNAEKELSQLQAKIIGMEDENARLKQQLTNSKDTNEELYKNASEMKDLKERNEKLEAERKQLQNAHAAVSKERDDLASRIFIAEEKLKELMKEIGDKNDDIQRLQTEVKNLQMNSNVSENEVISVKRQMDRLQEKISQLSNENSNLRKENVDVSRQKEDALERLSRLAGAKLTHGNAAITDLSDTDRPTKIAEKFSELYDNAWTDAFEELDTTYHNETETINVLLKILQEAYKFCVQTEKDYEDRINRAVFTLADEREITSADVAVQKALADLRISLGNPCCSVIEEMFLSRLPSTLRDLDVAVCPKTKIYARQCASLCWRMRIREPPVFVRFEFRKGTTFNADVLRKFTKTGGYLDFLVWPALYLHENGPLLAKGVAQPKLTP